MYWNYFLIGQIIFLDYGAESIRDYLKPLRYIPSHFEKLFCVSTFECDSVLISYFTCSYQSKQVFQETKILINFLQNYQKKIKRSILIRINSTIFRPDFVFGIPPKCACQIFAYLQCIKYTLDCFMYVQSVIIELGIICFYKYCGILMISW